jgi:hypothetical protein
MSKHTPGPWTEHKWNTEEHQISALGGTVALVSHSHSLISDESADANARLIAAAPDLLAACEALLAYANRYSDEMAKVGRGASELGELADSISVAGMARAAIARAKGGEPCQP